MQLAAVLGDACSPHWSNIIPTQMQQLQAWQALGQQNCGIVTDAELLKLQTRQLRHDC
jgi:hypothetical protein